MDQKQELRKRMKEKRDRISPQERRQKSAKICERLLSAPEYARFQKILVYAAIRSEVELQLFCDQALRDRKQIFFPKVCGKEMEFYRIENPGQLKKGMFSVPEPDVKQYPLSSFAENGEAWILVPGVAFDEKGMRLGYGGGFYDRYLKQKENLHRTGIAFGEQIVKRIPTEIHDHPMDDVITEALHHINRKSEEHHISVESKEEFLLAKMDAKLIVQVIINIVDNANQIYT